MTLLRTALAGFVIAVALPAVAHGADRFVVRDEPVSATSGQRAREAPLDFNLVGVARCVRAALPYLLASASGGNVVTIGSINGLVAARSEPYSAAKAGLQNLTTNLAARWDLNHIDAGEWVIGGIQKTFHGNTRKTSMCLPFSIREVSHPRQGHQSISIPPHTLSDWPVM